MQTLTLASEMNLMHLSAAERLLGSKRETPFSNSISFCNPLHIVEGVEFQSSLLHSSHPHIVDTCCDLQECNSVFQIVVKGGTFSHLYLEEVASAHNVTSGQVATIPRT